MEKEWEDVTKYFSKESKHGKCLLVDNVLDNTVEVRLYKVVESGFDYLYEIFVNSSKFYGSAYLDKEPYELMEEMKKDIYEESFKSDRYSEKFIDDFCEKYHIETPINDSSLTDRLFNSMLFWFSDSSNDLQEEDDFDDGFDDDDMAFDDYE